MSSKEKFPLDFWNRADITPLEVLGDILNEIRQPTKIIKGFAEVLLKADLPDEQRAHIEIILERAKYLETILDSGLEYGRRIVDSKSNNEA
jgi:signal transduction histidine kinase